MRLPARAASVAVVKPTRNTARNTPRNTARTPSGQGPPLGMRLHRIGRLHIFLELCSINIGNNTTRNTARNTARNTVTFQGMSNE